MAGSKRTDSRLQGGNLGFLATAALVIAWLPACSGGGVPEPQSLPPQTVTDTVLEAPPKSEPPVAAAVKDDTVIVIEESAAANQPATLVEAAAAEQDRRQQSGRSTVSITNENLEEYATGSLTFSDKEAVGAEVEAIDPETAELLASEGYWRRQVREARLRWRTAADQIVELEGEIAGLRRNFYAEDDPFYRDSQIKPAWDRSIVELDAARREAEEAQLDLTRVMEEGRRAGALPGWLREGIELEPEVDSDPQNEGSPAEPREPVTVDDAANG